jgi:hypothetical protein
MDTQFDLFGMVKTIGRGSFASVAIRGGIMFAQQTDTEKACFSRTC